MSRLLEGGLALLLSVVGLFAPSEQRSVTLLASEQECRAARAVEVWWLAHPGETEPASQGRGATVTDGSIRLRAKLVFEGKPTMPCRWQVPIPLTGRYAALLVGPAGVLAETTLDEQTPRNSTLRLEATRATVSGAVTYNTEPVTPLSLRLWRVTEQGLPLSGPIDLETDALGHFNGLLPSFGDYFAVVTFDQVTRPLITRITATESRRPVRLADVGGSCALRMVGSSPSEPVTLHAWSDDWNRTWTIRTESGLVRLFGIPPGRYRLVGVQSTGRVSSQPVEFEIRVGAGTFESSIAFVENRGSVAIFAPTGRALGATSIVPWAGRELDIPIQKSGDTYSLRGVPPGVDLQIHVPAPYIPTCRRLPVGERLEITAQVGRAVLADFARAGVAGPVGNLLGVESSDCPVPLASFDYRRPVVDKEVGVFSNFPNSQHLSFSFGGLALPVQYPKPDRVTIR